MSLSPSFCCSASSSLRGVHHEWRPSIHSEGCRDTQGQSVIGAYRGRPRLLVSSGELGPTASGDSQGRMAPGRAIPSSGLHRHQHVGWPRGGSAFLQWQRYCRAVDQGRQVRPELDPAVLPQVRGQPGATGSVHPSLQPGELAAQAMPAQGGQALVVAKPPGQTYQDRGEASSPRPAAGVSASRGSGASGGISTSAGAYRRAPSSTRVASILGIIGGDEDSQGGAVRLDELKRVQTC